MIAKLMEKNGVYYCSECRMCQYEPSYACKFCGNLFSNFSSMKIKEYEDERISENEENVYGNN